MAFKKGQSGNPAGRCSDKPWTRALERYAVQNPDKLASLAAKTFEKAIEGEMAAVREIGDRLDGKPNQSVDISGSLTSEPAELSRDELTTRIAELRAREESLRGAVAKTGSARKPH